MIGKRLKQLRTENKISQQELANRLGTVISSISMYESNERTPSPEILIKITNIFNCSLDYLFEITNNKNEVLKQPDDYFYVVQHAKEKKITAERLKKIIDYIDLIDEK